MKTELRLTIASNETDTECIKMHWTLLAALGLSFFHSPPPRCSRFRSRAPSHLGIGRRVCLIFALVYASQLSRMQSFLHPQSAAAGGLLLPVARAQLPIRHLRRPVSNKFSQKSVAKVLALGEADCVNRRVNFATTKFFTGEKKFPLQLPAVGSLLEHNCTASNVVGSLRTSVAVVAAATTNSSPKANADCIDNSAQLLTEDMGSFFTLFFFFFLHISFFCYKT